MDFSHAECSTQYLQVNVLQMMTVMSVSLWHQDLDHGIDLETCNLYPSSLIDIFLCILQLDLFRCKPEA